MSPAIYLPVISASIFNRYKDGWWNSQAPFKYPFAFASYYFHKSHRKLREEFKFDSDVTLYSDSGGYAVFAQGASIDPYDLADWYNTAGIDLAMQLDFPPYTDARKSQVVEFEKRLELTARSSKILIERVKSSIGLYATIHGVNPKQYDVWRSTMELVSDRWFGWAVGVAPINDPDAVLRIIRYLESFKNEKPVHFFELGDAVCFLLIARYANKRNLLVTSDSSYAVISARVGRSYLTILSRQPVSIGPRVEDAFKNPISCLCPVCTRYGAEKVREDHELINLHNIYLLIWRYQFLNSISTEKVEAIKQLFPEAVNYVRQLDAILEKRGGLLSYV